MDIDAILKAAERMSGMADKMAGFAISADLVLVFACLKNDLGQWVSHKELYFLIGIVFGALIYLVPIWSLYRREVQLEVLAGLTRESLDSLQGAARTLAIGRALGVILFKAIAFLAVLASSKGAGIT